MGRELFFDDFDNFQLNFTNIIFLKRNLWHRYKYFFFRHKFFGGNLPKAMFGQVNIKWFFISFYIPFIT